MTAAIPTPDELKFFAELEIANAEAELQNADENLTEEDIKCYRAAVIINRHFLIAFFESA